MSEVTVSGASASRGAATTIVAQLLRATIQFLGIAVLARLIAPADFGLITMVAAVIGVSEIFRDFGLSNAAVQARELSAHQRSNLFWVNAALGTFFALIAILVAPLIAGLYQEPRLVEITRALAVVFIFSGIGVQFQAHLTRNLRFLALSGSEVAAQVVGVVVAVALALSGAGVWALVALQVVQAITRCVLLFLTARWVPGRYRRGVPMRSFFRFGAGLMGVQLLDYASKNVDSIILGARFGPTTLGLYDRAFQLLTAPLNQINAPATRVALPVLSRLQSDRERYDRYLLTGQSVLLALVLSVFAFAGSQAPAVIEIVLGTQWEASAPIFQILAVAGMFQAAGYASYWVYLSKGLTVENLKFSLFYRPAVVVFILLGSNWGVLGVAAAYAVSMALGWPLSLLWLRRISDAPVGGMFLNGMRALTAFAICGLASFAATAVVAAPNIFLDLLVGLGGFLVATCVQGLLWPAFRRDLHQVTRIAALLKKSR